jgi:hypothetical protein
VGQNAWEEVDLIEGGRNYGWNTMEGFHCFRPSTNCDRGGLALPVAEYGHSEGRSITGGYVYRGPQLGLLQGRYIYGDFVSRRIWALHYVDGEVLAHDLLATSPSSISSFGEDEEGELFIVGLDGTIYVLDAPEPEEVTVVEQAIDKVPQSFELRQNRPNPFNAQTTVSFSLPRDGHSILELFDLGGRRAMTPIRAWRRAGHYELTLDFTHLASGSYLLQLRFGTLKETRKVMLVK